MIRILICDNDTEFMDCIEEIISDTENISITKMQFSVRFMDEVRKNPYDIIIMNTEFGIGNGISAAKKIREFDDEVKIIFIASDTKYCLESYSVNAYGFMLKPINSEELNMLIKKCAAEILCNSEKFVCLPIKSGFIRTDYSSIEYIETYSRNIEYHFIDGTTAKYIGYIKNIEECINKFPCFYRVLRSCIINMNHISKYENRNIHMSSGYIVSIGEKKSREVKEHLQKWIIEKSN